MRRHLGILAVLLALATSACAKPVAMVCYVSGKAEVKPKDKGWQPLGLARKLYDGDAIRTTGGQIIAVILGSSTRYRVTGQASVTDTGLSGASLLGGLSGPGKTVSHDLSESRTGASAGRSVGSNQPQKLKSAPDGWVALGTRSFEWYGKDADNIYSVSLLDPVTDDVLFHTIVKEPAITIDDDILMKQNVTIKPTMPFGGSKITDKVRPYILRWVGYTNPKVGDSQATDDVGWAVVSFLKPADLAEAQKKLKAFNETLAANPADVMSILFKAELFAQYGAVGEALFTLDDTHLQDRQGVDQARDEYFKLLGRFGIGLGQRNIPVEK